MEELLNKLRESTNDLEIIELKDKIIEKLSDLAVHCHYSGQTFYEFSELDTDDQDTIIDKMCFQNMSPEKAFASYLIEYSIEDHFEIYDTDGNLLEEC